MKITLHGPVAQFVGEKEGIIFNYPQEKIWNQHGISLRRRTEHDKQLMGHVKKALSANNLSRYIVPSDLKAPTRCIDGRTLKGWARSRAKQRRGLGPKVTGGVIHAALAHRIVDSERLRQDLQIEHDIQYVIGRYKAVGLGFGGHIDDNQHGWNTGCGAVDNINLILDRLQLPEPQQHLHRLANLILGATYDGPGVVNEIIGRMLYLDALKPYYLPRENNDPKGEFLYKQTIVDLIRREAVTAREPVPELIGPHHEVAIVFNFVPNTTFDTDRFSHDNGNDIQVFGWDIWSMYEEAGRLYNYEMHEAVSQQRRAIDNRVKYLTARTLLGVATTMALTDGSILAITVRPYSSVGY